MKKGLPGLAAFAAFFLALYLAAWLPRAVSLAFFPLKTVPAEFFLLHEAAEAGRYDAVDWNTYVSGRDRLGIRTFRLAHPTGETRVKATLSFRVLEDDGTRQLVEVQFDGPYQSWSRYEAYADRAVPLAYYSSAGPDDQGRIWPLVRLALTLAICLVAALGAHAAVKRVFP